MSEVDEFRFSPDEPAPKKSRIKITSSFERWAARVHIWEPPTDLFETEEGYVVQVEIAGMRDGEFVISLEERVLLVRGVRVLPSRALAYYQMEIPAGDFVTSVELPGPVEMDAVHAEYSDGFLRITLPKSRPHQVDVDG